MYDVDMFLSTFEVPKIYFLSIAIYNLKYVLCNILNIAVFKESI